MALLLRPSTEERDRQVWIDMVGQIVGQPYSLSPHEIEVAQLVVDGVGSFFGHQAVARLGGRVVCSVLAARYAQLVGERRMPSRRDPDSVSPADLGQLFVGRRAPRLFDA
jgi:hypothetical protein